MKSIKSQIIWKREGSKGRALNIFECICLVKFKFKIISKSIKTTQESELKICTERLT